MNNQYTEHYGASFGDYIDAKMKYFIYIDYKQKI